MKSRPSTRPSESLALSEHDESDALSSAKVTLGVIVIRAENSLVASNGLAGGVGSRSSTEHDEWAFSVEVGGAGKASKRDVMEYDEPELAELHSELVLSEDL